MYLYSITCHDMVLIPTGVSETIIDLAKAAISLISTHYAPVIPVDFPCKLSDYKTDQVSSVAETTKHKIIYAQCNTKLLTE